MNSTIWLALALVLVLEAGVVVYYMLRKTIG